MKKLTLLTFLLITTKIVAQNKYSNCSAAFLNNKMIVDKYDDKTKAKIPLNAIGVLTVCTANISEKVTLAVDKIPFMIAIKDHKTGTISLFSKKIYIKQKLENVLKQCQKGDAIVLLTTNNEYALPHNEILVE